MKAILIEAGHGLSAIGTKDVGAVGNGKTERDMVVTISRKVIDILKSKEELEGCLIQGVGVETSANLRKKINFVNHVVSENKFKPSECISVSIHMNSALSKSATGFELWHQMTLRKGTIALAESLVRSWGKYKITPLRPRAINNTRDHGRYHRLYIDDYFTTAVLIETSFISNKSDVDSISGNYDRVAECIAHGILEFIRNEEKS